MLNKLWKEQTFCCECEKYFSIAKAPNRSLKPVVRRSGDLSKRSLIIHFSINIKFPAHFVPLIWIKYGTLKLSQ